MTSLELISRTCTTEGWSRLSVPYYSACFQDNSTEQEDTGHRVKKKSVTKCYGLLHFWMGSRILFNGAVLWKVKCVIFSPASPNIKMIWFLMVFKQVSWTLPLPPLAFFKGSPKVRCEKWHLVWYFIGYNIIHTYLSMA